MEQAPSLDDFRRRLPGRYLVGRTWAHFCHRPELFGVMIWGRPTGEDMRELVQSLVLELGEGVVPHQSLVDTSRLRGVDFGAFWALQNYVRSHRAELHDRVTRLALVRPEGLEGAIVAGFYAILDSPYPVEVFDDVRRALGWLGEKQALAAELDAIHAEASGIEPTVGAVRAYIERHLGHATIEGAAREIGLEPRELKRRLRSAGSTFPGELITVRMAEARRRMIASSAPLSTIALEVGFSSFESFSAAFRRQTGESPGAWRRRNAPGR
jgi:AraC-like DNA-binding protein